MCSIYIVQRKKNHSKIAIGCVYTSAAKSASIYIYALGELSSRANGNGKMKMKSN